MNQNVYMLFDTISQLFIGSLSILINEAVAIRSFKEFVSDDKCPYKPMAKDINLYQIGTFNTATGEFVANKKFICNLENLLVMDKIKEFKKNDQ